MKRAKAILKPGREKSVTKRHPWIFSGAIQKIEGNPKNGEVITVYSSHGEFLAQAAWSSQSQIKLRIWTWNKDTDIDRKFFENTIHRAVTRRKNLNLFTGNISDNTACRLINSEADGLPGIIVDRYARVLVLQCLTAGAEPWKNIIADILAEITGISLIYEKSDADERTLEGLQKTANLLRGTHLPTPVEINEHGIRYHVDVETGHKTGFYLDQRDNRLLIREFAPDKEILNCFSYTGGFTLNALAAGAKEVTSADISEKNIEMAKNNAALNLTLDHAKSHYITADVFNLLREYRDSSKKFDLIILDPPKFASGTESLNRALRGYKDINLQALKILKPGGILFTFSCSGKVSETDFKKTVAWAALDAQVEAQILKRLHQTPDHPESLNFPEAAYLKGFVIQIAPE